MQVIAGKWALDGTGCTIAGINRLNKPGAAAVLVLGTFWANPKS